MKTSRKVTARHKIYDRFIFNANYNQKTDYMEITPYELVYMNKGKKVVKKHKITYEDIVEQLKKMV